jgi:hypothetical protein
MRQRTDLAALVVVVPVVVELVLLLLRNRSLGLIGSSG